MDMTAATKIPYSDGEQKLLDLIPKNGSRINTEEITLKRYAKEGEPFNARAIIRATLTQLIRKVDQNREPFRIRKGKRSGPWPIEVWTEKRR